MTLAAIMLAATLAGAGMQEPAYSEDDLYRMSHLIYGEAGNCSREMMEAVGSVVLNRVSDDRFPDTLADVIFQPGQYACTWDGNYDLTPSEEAVEAARFLLEEGSQLDSSVVWQAEFVQGEGIYKTVTSPWGSIMYFCY